MQRYKNFLTYARKDVKKDAERARMGRRLSGGTMDEKGRKWTKRDETGLKETKRNLWHDVCTRGCEGRKIVKNPLV